MKQIYYILYTLFLVAGFTSCVSEDVLDGCLNTESNKPATAQVLLSMSIPNSQLPSASRTVNDENAISSLWILEFEAGKLIEKIDITQKYKTSNGSRLYVPIKETDKPVVLSIVANSDVKDLQLGDLKADILKKLTFSNSNGLVNIPMYGETTEFENITREKTYDTQVELTRSVAKIEVQYDSSQSKDEFEFLGIEVMHVNTSGYVATKQGSYDQKTTNIVQNYQSQTISTYIAETSNTNTDSKVCVVVHGKYKGNDCYYRLDMINKSNQEIKELLRNYRYVFSLQNVNYTGRSKEDVITGESDNQAVNARVMTLSSEETDILDITTDDEYFLGVNYSTLALTTNDNGLCFAKLKVLTNNTAEGWVIKDAPTSGVTFNPGTSGGKASSEDNREVSTVWIYVNKSIIKEDFKFYITTGKIRKVITVKVN